MKSFTEHLDREKTYFSLAKVALKPQQRIFGRLRGKWKPIMAVKMLSNDSLAALEFTVFPTVWHIVLYRSCRDFVMLDFSS